MIKTLLRFLPQDLLTLIVITILIIIAGYAIGIAIIMGLYGSATIADIAGLNLSNPHMENSLWIFQIASTTTPIFAASFLFAHFIKNDTREYLKTSFKFPWFLMIVIFCVMVAATPLIDVLSNINQKLQLPRFLAGLQKWMRDTEDQAQKLTDVLLQMKTVGSMLFKLTFVGLLTAIVEEFMFRGCVQTILIKWLKNPHAAVWITAASFSAFHLEFFGFLPRLMLGALFGYFVLWSGSIWPAVWAHFINNGTAVILSYLYQNQMIDVNPNDTHLFNLPAYIFSLIIMLFLLYLCRNIATGRLKLPFK